MNHKIFSSLTASLLITTLGVLPSYANPTKSDSQGADTSSKPVDSNAAPISGKAAANTPTGDEIARVDQFSTEAVKIGEQKSEERKSGSIPKREPVSSSSVIAKVQPLTLAGRKSAILYVRNLPVLTFTGTTVATSGNVKVGVQTQAVSSQPDFRDKALGASKSPETPSIHSLLSFSQSFTSHPDSLSITTLDTESAQADPVWRATVLAARINQLYRDGVDAKKITVRWDDQQKLGTGDRFVIQVDQLPIATIDRNTTATNSNRNLEQDALWVANRLRRLLGNAEPLQAVAGRPSWGSQGISLGPIRLRLEGFASWYGPGFHGNPSASGERFNQYALTAAHRTLPFGTCVLVTNLENGQSVVVRINDRGPFHGNRIIDLSTGAARVLGLVQSGVARVRLEVIAPNNVATTSQ
ncbi:septal ring lytic transglycosylase RlpA family protein [Leptodesmis sp.]|uniref:septal ring lytic transglycosylase RlpA family protein n=1 Tax=Leptodesmis sp. TaxID=3100501 RepID=UPI0040535007